MLSFVVVSRNDTDPLNFRRLNFARLLLLYTRKFESSNPCQAVNYYFFLHDLPSSATDPGTPAASDSSMPSSMFVQCVAEVAIQTGEYDLLLGVIPQPTSVGEGAGAMHPLLRHPGAIDRFAGVLPPTRLIAVVAQTLETRGQMAEAVVVYRLAGGAHCLLSAVRLTNLLLVGVVASGTQDGRFAEVGGAQHQGDRRALIRLAADVGPVLFFVI